MKQHKKIDVFREANELDPIGSKWVYVWSTTWHKTCKSAVARAKELHPQMTFRAWFDK